MEKGYYVIWHKVFGREPEKTVGYYDGGSYYPWDTIGSDEPSTNEEVEVIRKLDID